MKKLLAVFLSLALLTGLCACSTEIDSDKTGSGSGSASASETSYLVIDQPTEVELGSEDVKITSAGTYTLSGELNGSVIVEVAGKGTVELVLDNVTINSGDFAAIYVIEADEVVITLAEGSVNTLSDNGSDYTLIDSNNVDALIFSKADLRFEGSGTLVLNAGYKHAVVSKDDLIINSGNYKVSAQNHAFEGKGCVVINGGNFDLTTGTDAIASDNEEDGEKGYVAIYGGDFLISSQSDGIYAFNYLNIEGGSFDLTTVGKAVKSDGSITISGGDFTISATDDGIHSNSSVTIENGTIKIDSDDDAIHADHTLTVNGGTLELNAHEALEETVIVINDGKIDIVATDDAINAGQKVDGITPTVEINGGELTIDMGQGDTDAIDSNGNIYINGGTVSINAQSPFDYDGTGELNGGTVTVNGTQITSLTNQMMGGGMGGFNGQMPGSEGNTFTPGEMPQGNYGTPGQMPGGQQGGQRPGGSGGFPGQGSWQ